jgi:hypothetical protein
VACLSSDIPSDVFVGHAADFHDGLNLCRVCCRRWLHLDMYSHNVGFLQLPPSSCVTVEFFFWQTYSEEAVIGRDVAALLIVNSLLKINSSNVCPPSHWNQNYEGISDVIVILTSVWKGLPKFSESLKLFVKLLMEKHVFWWVRNSLVGVMKFCGRCLMERDDLQLFHYLAVVAFLTVPLVITEFQCNRFLMVVWCCS